MRSGYSTILIAVAICGTAIASIASADIIRGIEIDFVTIGNPGNPGDTRTGYPHSAAPYGCGAVGYEYQIGKYEVTNAQWDAFVSAAGAPTGNEIGYSNPAYFSSVQQPTNNVSWYEAAQFCNYLTSGDKSQGAYQFSGDNTNPGDFLGINRNSAVSAYGIAYVIPTEDEWYKVAYYTGSDYSTYANGTDTAPIAEVESNYGGIDGTYSSPWNVGTGIEEQNGTFDMMGNVFEWNETLIPDSYRCLRGGSYYDVFPYALSSSYRDNYDRGNEYPHLGFRIASIPEPATFLLLGLGVVILRKKQ